MFDHVCSWLLKCWSDRAAGFILVFYFPACLILLSAVFVNGTLLLF